MVTAGTAVEPSPALLKVLDGTVDLHCHSGPSPFPRRLDHVEASYEGARIGMRAALVKSHHHNTVMDLLAMGPRLADAPTPMYGGVALNSEVGGMNPSAVAVAINMGGKCVWGPTVSAAQHIEAHRHDDGFPHNTGNLHETEVSVFDASGEVSEQTDLVTRLVADAGILLTGGHLDGDSMVAFFETASRNGVTRMLVHHPDYIIKASDQAIEKMLSLGAFVEHELSMYDPRVKAPDWPIEQLVDWIRKIGPERTVIDSDLGQVGNPLPVDAYLLVVQQLLDHGIPAADIRQMICRNTAFLLGLEETS
ncbi:DUF6282 family protein [Modestobacter versicolor]|uniref:Cytosolic protein n=1 Tax=Modestobacter versicolor TaxID=429133 RepID=A0A323VE30_9ACTN|nr:DUF6282 family protein [Modestobacter versicolor]MBB3674867.1 hypothetical protein [Modestobacter versicolor]PZA22905.1 hypothetical protein DMO24_02480 [Modestobacter versicolor]